LSSTNRDGEQKDSRRVFGFRPSAIRRIVILGCAGSGKTILARRLG
jgi:GTPase SAR1 family protein